VTSYSAGRTEPPSIAVDSSNQVHWCGSLGSLLVGLAPAKDNIHMDPVQPVAQVAEEFNSVPSIAVDGGDNVHVVWAKDNEDLWVRSLSAGAWQSPVRITTTYNWQWPALMLWATHPTVAGAKPSRPKTGYAFSYLAFEDGIYQIRYYASPDLTWDSAGSPCDVNGSGEQT